MCSRPFRPVGFAHLCCSRSRGSVHSLLPSQLYLLCRSSHSLHSLAESAFFRPFVALPSMKPFYLAKRNLQLVPAATLLVALAIPTKLSGQTITTFDAPGAGTGALQGTYATNLNPSGTSIGFSRDAADVRHGFVRSQDGSFTIFDAPGAGTAAFQGTRAYATNPSGTITGWFIDTVG